MSLHSTPSAAAEAAPKTPGPGRPKDLGKRAAILEAAKQLFVREGYGVSMDQIAAAAGVSKLTVYSHFGDKEALFTEAIRAKCDELLPKGLFRPDPQAPLREQLLAIAQAFFALVGSEEALSMQRMLLSPTQTDARIREMFWNAGARPTVDAFSALLRARADAGELAIDDIDRAAHQFLCLAKGELHHRLLCGLGGKPSHAEVDAHLRATVDFFLRACAPR
ncbi:MAG: TetR/AcrR family transcriptional regulator [Pseudoxanthomonas sp.]